MTIIFGVLLGFHFYATQHVHAVTQTQDDLAVVAALKVKQITDWRDERLGDANVAMKNPLLIHGWVPDQLAVTDESLVYLESVKKEYGFCSILLVDPATHEAVNLEGEPVELHQPVLDVLASTIEYETVVVTGLHIGYCDNRPHMDLVIPFPQAVGEQSRVLLFQISTEDFLYPLLQSWPSPSETGETLLVEQIGDRVLFLNDLRHVEDAALNLSIPLTKTDVPAVMAVNGITGPVEGLDYRNVPVIAVIQPVPDTDWFMISKMDQSEINQDWRTRTIAMSITVIFFIITVISVAGLLWQRYEKQSVMHEVEIVEALKESEERFRSYIENAPTGIFVASDRGEYIEVNPAASAITGYSQEELLGMNLRQLLPEHAEADAREYFGQLQQTGVASRELPFLTKSGEIRYWSLNGVKLSDHSFLAFAIDVTQQNQMVTELQGLQAKFDMVMDVTVESIWEWDVVTDEVFWTDSLENLFGELNKTHYFSSWGERLHPDDREEVLGLLQQHLSGELPMWQAQYRIQVADGSWVWVLGKGRVIERDTSGQPLHMVGTFSDITDLKILQEIVDYRRKQLERILDILPVGIWLADIHGDLYFANAQAERIWGMKKLVSAKDYQVFHGWRLPAHEKVQPDDWSILHSIREGVVIEDELLEIEAADGTRRIILAKTSPLYDQRGNIEGGIEVNYDITSLHQAQAQINELNADLEQRVEERTAQLQEANQELEAFVYSVSHDLRAPLRAIDGFSHLLDEKFGSLLPDGGLRYLQIISKNIQRMNLLIDGLLNLSKVSRQHFELTPMDMNALVSVVIQESLGEWKIRPEQISVGELQDALGNQILVEQVWKNLLDNAIKYSQTTDSVQVQIDSYLEDGFVVYCVKDHGIGFDNQHADKLFGVFERLTNRDQVEGVGIGLAIVQRIVTRHGGRVWAQGEEGKGASFFFSLPKV